MHGYAINIFKQKELVYIYRTKWDHCSSHNSLERQENRRLRDHVLLAFNKGWFDSPSSQHFASICVHIPGKKRSFLKFLFTTQLVSLPILSLFFNRASFKLVNCRLRNSCSRALSCQPYNKSVVCQRCKKGIFP